MSEPGKTHVNWSMICHLSGLSMYLAIPLGNVWIPLILWAAKRKSDPTLDVEGKEAINFNLSVTVYGILAGLLCYVVIGFLLLPALLIAHVILTVQAGIKANRGEPVHYPMTLRFMK